MFTKKFRTHAHFFLWLLAVFVCVANIHTVCGTLRAGRLSLYLINPAMLQHLSENKFNNLN
jgi:hypothetical protein